MMCEIFVYFVFFKKFDFDPYPELSEKSDPEPDPDPEIIFSALTHCFQ